MNLFDAKPSYEELEARVVELEQEVAELRKVKPKGSASRFAEFWTAYPNKRGKQAAEKKWKVERLDEIADTIIQHVYMMIEQDDYWRQGIIPDGSTYVNQARWQDMPKAAPVKTAQPSKQMQALMQMGGMNGLDRGRATQGLDAANVSRAALGAPRGHDAGNAYGVERGGSAQSSMGSGDGWPSLSRRIPNANG